MDPTVDGRIIGENWKKNLDKYGALNEDCHDTFNSKINLADVDGWPGSL